MIVAGGEGGTTRAEGGAVWSAVSVNGVAYSEIRGLARMLARELWCVPRRYEASREPLCGAAAKVTMSKRCPCLLNTVVALQERRGARGEVGSRAYAACLRIARHRRR